MIPKLKHIVILPRWYPNTTDIQLGIFIQRQLLLLKDDYKLTVIYVQAIEAQENKYSQVSSKPTPTLTEHIIYFRSATGPFRKITNFIRFNRAQKVGMAKIKTQIDAFHIHVPYRTALPALRALRKSKTPFYITEHWSGHLNGNYTRKNSLDRLLYRYVLNRATKISTVSNVLMKAFQDNTGFESSLIPNLIEQDASPDQKQVNSTDIINILSVGDLIDQTKNQTSLLIAFSISLHQNKNLRLTLIGGGPDEAKIKRLANELKIDSAQLIFKGRQNHEYVLSAMNNCDFYICNSRFETFGMTIAEALMCGKPVISTRCGGPKEFLNASNSISIDVKGKPEKNKLNLAAQMNISSPNYEELSEAIDLMATTYKNYNSIQISSEIEAKFGSEAVRKKWLSFFND